MPGSPAAEDSDADVSAGIRDAILAGDYAPSQRLVEADLCAEFGVSRSVVRVALQVLVHEGLVEIQRHKGARVRAVELAEVLEIVEVRTALEALVVARAARLATAADDAELAAVVEAMGRAVEMMEILTYRDLNQRFHATIARIAGNATCDRILEQLRAQVARQQFAVGLQPGRLVVSLGEHQRIATAIAARDPGGAEAAMRVHLASMVEQIGALRLRRYH